MYVFLCVYPLCVYGPPMCISLYVSFSLYISLCVYVLSCLYLLCRHFTPIYLYIYMCSISFTQTAHQVYMPGPYTIRIQAFGNVMIGQHRQLVNEAIPYICGAKVIPTSYSCYSYYLELI